MLSPTAACFAGSAPAWPPTRTSSRDGNRTGALKDGCASGQPPVATQYLLELSGVGRRRSYKSGQELAARRLTASIFIELPE